MCGIIGFNWEDKSNLKSATDKLTHRGPDNKGHYLDKNISLGHRRLSIIDLSDKANQPMTHSDLVLIYNGEIYNFKEIRKKLEAHRIKFETNSDTEVVLKTYSLLKEKALHLFNGMFAFAIYDKREKSIFLARDRLGIKPLYYYFDGEKFIFTSEIKAILDLEINTELDYNSINNYFIYRYLPENNTPFKHIKKLLPGHYLKFKNNKLEIKKY
jgi:asparagine synthase (glutamine-hydrolysing)